MKSAVRLFVLAAVAAVLFWLVRNQTPLFEKILNKTSAEYFENSIRLKRAGFDSRLRLGVEGFQGNLKTSGVPYPIEIRSLQSQNSVLSLVLRRPVTFVFDGVRLHDSPFEGMEGWAVVQGDGSFKLRSEIKGMGLEDLAALNPENLQGASGELHGWITLEIKPAGEPVFESELHGKKSGGKIPARFFAAVLPYLPASQNRKELEGLIRVVGLLTYQEADLKIGSAGAGRMKVFLHMLIPDYNFNLNLNLDIRVDEENFFRKLNEIQKLFAH